VLHLGNCGIGVAGIASIAEALRSGNSRLTELDLGYNSIGAESITALAQTIEKHNDSLLTLHLAGNDIEAGAGIMAPAIAANPAARVPLRPEQRFAFLTGCNHRTTASRSRKFRLPPDLVQRILTHYRVAQGTRIWKGMTMTTKNP
jgi:hypothetical protein